MLKKKRYKSGFIGNEGIFQVGVEKLGLCQGGSLLKNI
jgi:hypothetical protein